MYIVSQDGAQVARIRDVSAVRQPSYGDDKVWCIYNGDCIIATYSTQEARDAELKALVIALRLGQHVYQFSEDLSDEV